MPKPTKDIHASSSRHPLVFRDRATALTFFDGLEVVEPGLVQVHKWRPDGSEAPGIKDKDIAMYGAVARKL